MPAHDGIDLAIGGHLRQVAAEMVERRCLALLLAGGGARGRRFVLLLDAINHRKSSASQVYSELG